MLFAKLWRAACSVSFNCSSGIGRSSETVWMVLSCAPGSYALAWALDGLRAMKRSAVASVKAVELPSGWTGGTMASGSGSCGFG